MNVLVFGACGAMGKETIDILLSAGHKAVGVDPKKVPSDPLETVPIFCDLSLPPVELNAVIDFSAPNGIKERLEFAEKKHLPVVVGTTGFSEAEQEIIDGFSKKIPIFESANFSLGIYALKKLIAFATPLLKGFDVEIVEKHHAQKCDVPSGTAIELFREIKREKIKAEALQGRSESKKRSENQVGIHSVRGGTAVGEHQILYLGDGEEITLTHLAESKRVFALGALKAMEFLKTQPVGKYGMDDLFMQRENR